MGEKEFELGEKDFEFGEKEFELGEKSSSWQKKLRSLLSVRALIAEPSAHLARNILHSTRTSEEIREITIEK